MTECDIAQRLEKVIEPVVTDAGLWLEDIELRGTGKQRVLQVLVDVAEDEPGSVTLEQIATVSGAISDVLDHHDLMDGPAYELEVSSPGATRELKHVRHWKRALGREVALTPVDAARGGKFVARVLDIEPGEDHEGTHVLLQRSVQVKKGMPVKLLEPERWQLSQIRRAKVEIHI